MTSSEMSKLEAQGKAKRVYFESASYDGFYYVMDGNKYIWNGRIWREAKD